ncbi:MAG: hypothetical protein IJR86_01050 [Bacteroidaceae bacterium]|nr:hypothetical protein [Bacteroidaceae bacterium]
MYSGERHIDSGYAMSHNNRVEAERQAEHLYHCAESPSYKRVYERWVTMNSEVAQQTATVLQAINEQMLQTAEQPLGGSTKYQTAKQESRPVPVSPPDDIHHFDGLANPLSWFFLGMMFADDERLKQMKEDMSASKQMQEVNERYDRQIIHLSGFEW